MGCRIADNFLTTDFNVHYLEVAPRVENLRLPASQSRIKRSRSPIRLLILAYLTSAIGTSRGRDPVMRPGACCCRL